MNKIYYIGLAALFMGLSACSSDTDSLEPKTIETPKNSDQEIAFKSTTTRASINNTDGDPNLWSVDGISVTCLAKSTQTTNSGAYEIDWTLRNQEGRRTFVQMENVNANVNDGAVSWNGHYYYPDVSFWYNYTFRGYYPHQATNEMTWTASTVKTNVEFDGTTDVLFGIADSQEQNAYSARYFHNLVNDGIDYTTKLPVMDFKHLFSRLVFYVKKGTTTSESTVPRIQYIRALNMYNQIELTLADLDTPSNDGTFRVIGTANNTFTLKKADGQAFPTMEVPEVATQVGESMLVYPSAAIPTGEEVGFRFEIGLEDPNDPNSTITSEHILLPLGGGEFLAGTSYNIIITIDGLEEITMKASLQPWVDAPSTIEI